MVNRAGYRTWMSPVFPSKQIWGIVMRSDSPTHTMPDDHFKPQVNEVLGEMFRHALAEPSGNLWLFPFILKRPVEHLLARLNRGRFESEHRTLDQFIALRIRVRLPRVESAAADSPGGEFILFPVSGSIWCFASAARSEVFKKAGIGAVQNSPSLASQIFVSRACFINRYGLRLGTSG